MLKKIWNADWRMPLVIVVYVVGSLVLLGGCLHGEREHGLYTMGVTWLTVSEDLGTEPSYRQGFYTPGSCSGIQLCVATDGTEAQRDLVVRIHVASSGELVGEHVVPHDKIGDNQYVDVMFEDYVLENGKQYYFEAYTTGEGENPLRFWMGAAGSGFCLEAERMGEAMPGTSIVFNLIYDYTDWGFVVWMFVSVVFLFLGLKTYEAGNGKKDGKDRATGTGDIGDRKIKDGEKRDLEENCNG